MSKTLIIAVLIGAVGIAGGAYLLTKESTQPAGTPPDELASEQVAPEDLSFSEFMQQNVGSYSCEVEQRVDAGLAQATTGTVFIHDGKIRGDYTTDVQGMNIKTSVIVRDDMVYTWTSMAPFGIQAPVVTDGGQAEAGWSYDSIGSYTCDAATVDASVFELPTGIQFRTV